MLFGLLGLLPTLWQPSTQQQVAAHQPVHWSVPWIASLMLAGITPDTMQTMDELMLQVAVKGTARIMLVRPCHAVQLTCSS